MYAAVKSANPNWKPGQAFDTGILDNFTRESVEATLVQNGNRLVRRGIYKMVPSIDRAGAERLY